MSRTIGIMPEKAFKMQGWVIVGNFVESCNDQAVISKWLMAGAAAGAATTIIGENYGFTDYLTNLIIPYRLSI